MHPFSAASDVGSDINIYPIRKSIMSVHLSSSKHASLFDAHGLKWKRQRSIINPTFSASKLKQMSPLINDRVDRMINMLSSYCESNQEFDIYVLYKRMTMDVVCRCIFGIDTDMQSNPENMYLKQAEKFFALNILKHPIYKLRLLIPEFNTLFAHLLVIYNHFRRILNKKLPFTIKMFEQMPLSWFLDNIHKIVEMRVEKGDQDVDLLQLMLDAATRHKVQ
ncbi:unnamed protein product, partial [Didymodactylos carnosus]